MKRRLCPCLISYNGSDNWKLCFAVFHFCVQFHCRVSHARLRVRVYGMTQTSEIKVHVKTNAILRVMYFSYFFSLIVVYLYLGLKLFFYMLLLCVTPYITLYNNQKCNISTRLKHN